MDRQDNSDIPVSTEEEVFTYSILKKMGCNGREAIAFTKNFFNLISEPIFQKIDESNRQLNDRMDALESKFDSKIDAVESKMDALETKFDSKMDALESKMDAFNSKLDAQNSKYNLLIGLVSGGITLILALGIAIVGWLLTGGGSGS